MTQRIPKQDRRGPSLETLVFKMGGVAGAARRIISHWERPFTANQLKVAIVRRHPQLIPAEHQVEDILGWMVRQGKLSRLDGGSFQRGSQNRKRLTFQSAKVTGKKIQLHFAFK